MTPLHSEELTVGRRWESAARTITEADIVAFAGVRGDFNPIHVDAGPRSARASRTARSYSRLPSSSAPERAAACVVELVDADAPTRVLEATDALGGPGVLVNNGRKSHATRALAMRWAPRLRVETRDMTTITSRPERYNASRIVDQHIEAGRGDKPAFVASATTTSATTLTTPTRRPSPPTPDRSSGCAASSPARRRFLVRGVDGPGVVELGAGLAAQDDELTPADTHRDDMAFWLWATGSRSRCGSGRRRC